MSTDREPPRYLAIAEQLQTELDAIGPGGRVGSERSLAERFSCQRMTARRALHHLETAGVVYRRDRSGWYRTPDRLDHDLLGGRPLAELVAEQGRELRTEVLTVDGAEPRSGRNGFVFLGRRRRVLDGRAIVAEDLHVATRLGTAFAAADLTDSTGSVLARLGVEVTREDVEVVPTAAEHDWVTAALGVRHGSPALEVTRRRWSGDELVQEDVEWWRADAVRLRVSVRPGPPAGRPDVTEGSPDLRPDDE
ncbi:MAG: GntR family transcriptional regulator [Actinomycetota bacterium]|nr:GntR family transcriptional regulator [Actinomycetota bacterium]